MPEFEIQCQYTQKKQMKFFRDKGLRLYHQFSVINPEIIPNEYFHFAEKKSCLIWILNELTEAAGINFVEKPLEKEEYKFIINLGGEKVAKFNTNSSNKMVLKTKEYWENTIKKIGFAGSENYFYEIKKMPEKSTRHPSQTKNKSN
ncbi:12451_t:CDS:1 [Funneliformis geosporum]|uniref:12451_t:CDS:1 n=1 Tax=Funneliformis geosporum TaxID=1117311 RepID=A0A9W4SAI0_9GLOM|nr:12451_t:CDS:1 [Funneliformis geosporum]